LLYDLENGRLQSTKDLLPPWFVLSEKRGITTNSGKDESANIKTRKWEACKMLFGAKWCN
jgi:hypothetical protein